MRMLVYLDDWLSCPSPWKGHPEQVHPPCSEWKPSRSVHVEWDRGRRYISLKHTWESYPIRETAEVETSQTPPSPATDQQEATRRHVEPQWESRTHQPPGTKGRLSSTQNLNTIRWSDHIRYLSRSSDDLHLQHIFLKVYTHFYVGGFMKMERSHQSISYTRSSTSI